LHVNIESVKKEIKFYRKSFSDCPVQAFLDSLQGKVAQKVIWVLGLVEDIERVPAQYFCKLADTEGIWEFRIKLGRNIYRVLAFWDGNLVVVTHGFIKKTQKTPLQEIERAENYRQDYFSKKG
jgi:phage-related protein